MTARILRGPKSVCKKDTRTVGELYFEEAIKHDKKICQIDAATGAKETFSSVRKRTTLAAISLRKLGVNSEDIILFCSKNTLDNMIPLVASLYLGAKVASVDPTLSPRDCAHCIGLVEPRVIFAEEDCEKLMEDSLAEAGHNSTIIIFGNSKKFKTLTELIVPSPEENNFKPVKVDCHETAFIYFSSGTTGLPKGICISHFGMINSQLSILEQDHFKTDVMIHVSSLYWISAGFLMTLSFIKGGCRVLAPKFEAENFLQLIEKYKITYTFMAPICTYSLTSLKNVEDYDTSSLQVMLLGGSPTHPEQLEKTRKLFKHTHVTIGYGSTEAIGHVSIFDSSKDRELEQRKMRSCGKCAIDKEVKVVDIETRQLLGPNEQGEICFRSPYAMKGYHKLDSSDCFDDEGFIKTGDIGYYDEDECLYIIDRIKEMFKYKSWHVVPASLEALLLEYPTVQEAVVFGIPHKIDEFHPAACIVLKKNAETNVEKIQTFVSRRVAEWHKLRGGIKILKSIPRSPTGKLQRNNIRDIFLNM